jgi:hypothetical protein
LLATSSATISRMKSRRAGGGDAGEVSFVG